MPPNVNIRIPEKELEMCRRMLALFTLEGQSVDKVATPGQVAIFHAIVFRPHWMMQILCSTQYGKSLFVALALLVVSCVQEELACVVAPSADKAKIIMRYYIEHMGDNPLFHSQLEKETRLERLRMEDSKERIVLRNGGGVYILSAGARSASKGIESAIGAGARVVITDESSLIPDQIEATIFRMIAGKDDQFYCKIGNPFYRNHFLKSWLDHNYRKIFIDYHQALAEGRYNEAFIEQAKKKPHFDVLFGCEFPPESATDDKGFIRLLTDAQIAAAIGDVDPFGEWRLGTDVAEGGGDYNSLVERAANQAAVQAKWQSEDTMDTAAKALAGAKKRGMLDRNIFVDTIGVGKGVHDRLVEHNTTPTGVKFSEKADDEVQFANKRAECYWRLREWVLTGGRLSEKDADEWWGLQHIKYRVDFQGRIIIKSKDDMRKEGIPSPDVLDGLAMTFARKSILKPNAKAERMLVKEFDAHRQRGGAYFTGSRY